MENKIKFLASLVLLSVLLFCGCLDETSKYSNEVSSGGIIVYYTEDVSAYDAEQVVDYFIQAVGSDLEADFFLSRVENGQGYEILVVTVCENQADFSETDKYVYQGVAWELSQLLEDNVVLKTTSPELEILYTAEASY